MNKQFFISNRKNLFNLMENNSLAIFSAKKSTSGILPVEFIQNKNFYYLSGLNVPNAKLIMHKKGSKNMELLFIERNIPELEVWLGKKMSMDEAKKISGIEKISYIDRFEGSLHALAQHSKICYYDYETHPINSSLSDELVELNQIRQYYPTLTIKKATPFLAKLRMRKSKEEINNIRKAISYTNSGIKSVWKHTKSGMMEYELEAYFAFEWMRQGEKHYAFAPIIANGKNATILHYESNTSEIEENSLVLLDVGAKCQEYNADISRTFPACGKFNKRQKEIYNEVLQVQKKIINYVKPGITIKQLQNKTVESITDTLFRLKLITKKEEYEKYYMHSVSHHLGLDTHDLSNREEKLQVGNVITVEPGIYIKEEKIGVRIEDDILVTENGCENLSSIIPKEIEEIEEIMAKRE